MCFWYLSIPLPRYHEDDKHTWFVVNAIWWWCAFDLSFTSIVGLFRLIVGLIWCWCALDQAICNSGERHNREGFRLATRDQCIGGLQALGPLAVRVECPTSVSLFLTLLVPPPKAAPTATVPCKNKHHANTRAHTQGTCATRKCISIYRKGSLYLDRGNLSR